MSLSQLPNELIREIAWQTDFEDLRRWVRVARRFHWLIMDVLYTRAASRSVRIAEESELGSPCERGKLVPGYPLCHHTYAATSGNLSAFRALVEKTKDINNPNVRPRWTLLGGNSRSFSMTLLHLVSGLGEVEMTRVALDAGAVLTAKGHDGYTPLHYAAVRGQTSTAAILLQAGSDPNAACTGISRRTPLHSACSFGHAAIVRLMLDHGADISIPLEFYPVHPLFLAVESGDRETVRVVVDAGADITARGTDDSTALHAAARCHRENDIIPFLLALGVDEYARTTAGNTPLHRPSNAASVRDLLHHAPWMITCRNDEQKTPLETNYRLSWFHAHQDLGVALLARSEVQLPGSQFGIEVLCEAAKRGSTATLSWLLDTYGTACFGTNSFGSTPLHVAALHGKAVVVKQLILAGIDPDVRCKHNRTALYSAGSTYCETSQNTKQSVASIVEALMDGTSFDEPIDEPVDETAKQEGSIPVIKVLLHSWPGIHRWDDSARRLVRCTLVPTRTGSSGGTARTPCCGYLFY